jgi:hypothetical protein
MEKARLAVKSIEITKAVRSTKIGKLTVKKGQTMGFLDGDLVSLGGNPTAALLDVLCNHVNMGESEMVTIYYGDHTGEEEAQNTLKEIQQQWTQIEAEAIYGGQPHYSYIASVE